MAIHRQNPRVRTAVAPQVTGMEQHLMSGFVLALVVFAVLLTLAG